MTDPLKDCRARWRDALPLDDHALQGYLHHIDGDCCTLEVEEIADRLVAEVLATREKVAAEWRTHINHEKLVGAEVARLRSEIARLHALLKELGYVDPSNPSVGK